MKKNLILIPAALILLLSGFSAYMTAPKVIETYPKNGAKDVDPSLKVIWVKFDQEMKDKSYSWCEEKKDNFPQINGEPIYTENNTKNSLPVKLEPNKEYVIWINSAKFKNFQDKASVPCEPYKFTFKTK